MNNLCEYGIKKMVTKGGSTSVNMYLRKWQENNQAYPLN